MIEDGESKSAAHSEFWAAVMQRDRGPISAAFVYAVSSTGIYCRAYCPSRRPTRDKTLFFDTPTEAETAGYRACLRCRPAEANPKSSGEQAVLRACEILDQRFDESLRLKELAAELEISPAHLQRTFKQIVGVSPHEYARSRRLEHFRIRLQNGESVSAALINAGYGSTSRVYENSSVADRLGASPSVYRKHRDAMPVKYLTNSSPRGWVLIAATERGICSLTLGDNPEALASVLLAEFPAAQPARDQDEQYANLQAASRAVAEHLKGADPVLQLPLAVQATAFQAQVWKALQAIPYGETRSYSEVAQTLGRPTAARAVARACASNPVALAVPCHRVIGSNGALSGYRWGIERKAALLHSERSHQSKSEPHK